MCKEHDSVSESTAVPSLGCAATIDDHEGTVKCIVIREPTQEGVLVLKSPSPSSAKTGKKLRMGEHFYVVGGSLSSRSRRKDSDGREWLQLADGSGFVSDLERLPGYPDGLHRVIEYDIGRFTKFSNHEQSLGLHHEHLRDQKEKSLNALLQTGPPTSVAWSSIDEDLIDGAFTLASLFHAYGGSSKHQAKALTLRQVLEVTDPDNEEGDDYSEQTRFRFRLTSKLVPAQEHLGRKHKERMSILHILGKVSPSELKTLKTGESNWYEVLNGIVHPEPHCKAEVTDYDKVVSAVSDTYETELEQARGDMGNIAEILSNRRKNERRCCDAVPDTPCAGHRKVATATPKKRSCAPGCDWI